MPKAKSVNKKATSNQKKQPPQQKKEVKVVVVANKKKRGRPRRRVKRAKDNGFVFAASELLSFPISATAGKASGIWNFTTYNALFPKLANVARMYQYYNILNLMITFEPTGVTLTSTGRITVAWDPALQDTNSIPDSYAEVSNRQVKFDSTIAKLARLRIPRSGFLVKKYSTSPETGQLDEFTIPGSFVYYADGVTNGGASYTGVVGYLRVSYVVRFTQFKPVMSIPQAVYEFSTNSTDVASIAWSTAKLYDTIGISSSAGTQLILPPGNFALVLRKMTQNTVSYAINADGPAAGSLQTQSFSDLGHLQSFTLLGDGIKYFTMTIAASVNTVTRWQINVLPADAQSVFDGYLRKPDPTILQEMIIEFTKRKARPKTKSITLVQEEEG